MSRIEEIRAELKACDDAHAAYDTDENGVWGTEDEPLSAVALERARAYREAASAVSNGAYYKIRDLLAEVDKAQRAREFTHDWYANRLDRLRKLADDNGLTDQHCSIVANGTADHMERPPDYGNVLYVLRLRAEKAEQERDRLARELDDERRQRLRTEQLNEDLARSVPPQAEFERLTRELEVARATIARVDKLADRLHEMAKDDFRHGRGQPGNSEHNIRGWEQNSAGNAIKLALCQDAKFDTSGQG